MPDISIEPIPADEPVAPAGFPPLPDRFDLGVTMGWAAGSGRGGGYGGGGSGGGGNGGGSGGSGSGGGNGGNGTMQQTGSHQHYNHYDPGSFGASASHGYYKARTPDAPQNPSAQGGGAQQGDVYMSGGGTHKGATSAGGGRGGGGGNAFSGLGREPKLKDKDDTSMTPDAPQAVTINQATTQDLSLPEDEFQYQRQNNPNNKGNKFAKSLGKALLRPVNSVGAYAGIRF
jgi:hypothetical protein